MLFPVFTSQCVSIEPDEISTPTHTQSQLTRDLRTTTGNEVSETVLKDSDKPSTASWSQVLLSAETTVIHLFGLLQ